jgi:hypothetical protein
VTSHPKTSQHLNIRSKQKILNCIAKKMKEVKRKRIKMMNKESRINEKPGMKMNVNSSSGRK